MNSNDINEWTKNLINIHKNPLSKIDLCDKRVFTAKTTEADEEISRKRFEAVKSSIEAALVEKRCERIIGKWLSLKKLVLVTKIVGCITHFGFEDKTGRFLYPEEALFLLEANRLELFNDGISLTIQEAYDILLDNSGSNLRRYIIYKRVAKEGIEVIRHARVSDAEPEPKRICLSGPSGVSLVIKEPKCKLKKFARNLKHSELDKSSNEALKNTLSSLKAHGPQQFVAQVETEPDYSIVLGDGSNLHLCISDSSFLPPNLGLSTSSTPTIASLAACNPFSGYFHFANFTLPDLL